MNAEKLEFPDEYFDLVYIDSNHFFDHVVRDLECWWPKVRLGGYIAGHDYFAPGDKRRSRGSEVRAAVDQFFGEGNYRTFDLNNVFYKRKL